MLSTGKVFLLKPSLMESLKLNSLLYNIQNQHQTKFSYSKKASVKIARLHSKIANTKRDILDKLTTIIMVYNTYITIR